jgi:hypothetical protein
MWARQLPYKRTKNRLFEIKENRNFITEVDSQRTQDEFYENVKFATPASTDEALVAAAKSGDHQAFLELWTRHSSRAFKATYRITGNREDPEDATLYAVKPITSMVNKNYAQTPSLSPEYVVGKGKILLAR